MTESLSPRALSGLLRARWPILALFLIFLLALAVRTVDLTDNPRGFFADEASFGVNADLILHTGKDEYGEFLPLLFRAFGEYKLPIFAYAELPFIAVLGRTELAVRLTAAVIGSLTVIATYLLAKELFKREAAALAAAALLAILPWHIHYSRVGMEIVVLPLMLSISLWLFLRAMRQGSSIVPAVVAFGLTFYSYRAAWVLVPPLMLVLVAMYYRELLKRRREWLASAVILLMFGLPLLRHVLSDTGDRSTDVSIFKAHSGQGTVHLFWDFYKSYFSPSFLFEKGDNQEVLRHYLPGHGELYWFLAPLIVIGVIALLVRLERRSVIVIALLAFFPLSGALSDHSPISSRTIAGSLAFVLVCTAGIALVFEVLERFPERIARGASVAFAIGLLIAAAVSFQTYFDRYQHEYPKLAAGYWGWQDGPEEIFRRFVQVQDRYDELWMDGEFNAPQIFVRFYTGDGCKKCNIGGVDKYNPAKRQLFALRPKNISPDRFQFVVRDSLYYPSGEQSFMILEILGPALPPTLVRP